MDDVLKDLDLRAATIDELLSDEFLPLQGEKKDAQKAAARLAGWCNASASGDWGLFARRLARDGLSLESVLPRLATVRRNPAAPVPTWWLDAQWIVSALKASPPPGLVKRDFAKAEPLAFESLLCSTVDVAQRELRSRMQFGELSQFSAEALSQLNRSLLKQLSVLCAPAFFDGFHVWSGPRRKEKQKSAPSNGADAVSGDEFDAFVLHMRALGLDHLLLAKPVLLRLIATTTRQWIETTSEFIIRLASDIPEVRSELLGLAAPSLVACVQGELSDLHNSGHSVLMVGFEDGCRILYKPKDLGPDAAWHRLVSWLNANGAPVDLRAAKVITRDGYGWAEFVEHGECADPSGVEKFYTRAGAWLGLFHVFAAADMHLENMIAAGDQPVPIDLEMILQAGDLDGGDRVAERAALELARKRISESITSIGLLPTYTRGPENDVVGLGGLNGSKTDVIESYWEDVNTERMRPAQRKRVLATPPNIPLLNNSPVLLGEFTAALRAGFDGYGRFLVENKMRIVSQEFFEEFDSVPVRKLLKPTRFYIYLLERLKDHRNMGDGAQWSAHLEFIARLTDWDQAQDRLWPLFRAERNALADLNVPHFLAMSDGFEVGDRHGIVARDREESGLARALKRLHNFDKAELDWQIRIVNISTAGLQAVAKGEPMPEPVLQGHVPCNGDTATRSALLASARESVERIAAVAIKSGPGAAWIGLDWLGDSEYSQLVPLGFDLYNGAPGISLFLAAYAHVTGDTVAAELSVQGLAPLRSHLKGANAARLARGLGPGGASGLGSIVYALSTIGDLIGKDELLTDALQAARLFTDELIAADKVFDVMGGCAGGILGLLKLHRMSGDAGVLARANKCGEHLLLNRLHDDRHAAMWPGLGIGCQPLTGISHGAAGFCYALASLHQATGREDFGAAARNCIEFENRLFSGTHANWPDLRQEDDSQSWPCQWCYGAGGIGLARIATLRCGYADRLTLNADIVHAVQCVEGAWPSSVDNLCCGNLGNIELLDEAGIFLNRLDLRQKAEQRLLEIVAQAKSAGDYRWGGGDKEFNLGLFRGLAGIGYTALRRISPAIPNVLVLE